MLRDMNFQPFQHLLKDGWHYRDIPWCTDEYWQLLMEIIVESNVQLIICTRKLQEKLIRGQILINEQGLKNLEKWTNEQTENN